MPVLSNLDTEPLTTTTARFFQVLADPTRVRVLELLLAGERKVGDLVEATGQQQGRVSSHLACLRWCGFVATRREGKFVYYRIADDRVSALLHLAHGMLAEHAGAVAACVCCAPRTEDCS
jgi:ArsR family transcriptional regulator, cadmium/lead-responsive transcriptional repressor